MTKFNPTKIFEFAIKIEENGRMFFEKNDSVINDKKNYSHLF
jgi:hypothetical protein